MSVPVLTAVTDAVWEADLVSAFEHQDFGVVVVRRCVDLADLLAAASAGTARAVILSADLRRLDRDALARLATAGVAVIGLVAQGGKPGTSDDAERRLRSSASAMCLLLTPGRHDLCRGGDCDRRRCRDRWGRPAASRVRRSTRCAARRCGARSRARRARSRSCRWTASRRLGSDRCARSDDDCVVLATEAARLGCPSLLADADCYGGVIAQVLGLLDESPGLAAAVRQANAGNLDLHGLATLARVVGPNLRVLTGIARAERWPELRPSGLVAAYAIARQLAALTVVDCGFGLEQDEELSYDTTAPRRNGSTLATLADADHVVAVGSADPVGLQRLVRGLAELSDVLPQCRPQVVVNRVRKGPINGDAKHEIQQALNRDAGSTTSCSCHTTGCHSTRPSPADTPSVRSRQNRQCAMRCCHWRGDMRVSARPDPLAGMCPW